MKNPNTRTPCSNPAANGTFYCYYSPAFTKYAVPTSLVIRANIDALTALFQNPVIPVIWEKKSPQSTLGTQRILY